MKQVNLKGKVAEPGQEITISGPRGTKQAIWGGHARDLQWWRAKGNPIDLNIHADSFVQGEVTLRVPDEVSIQAIGFKHDIFTNGRKIYRAFAVKAMTRGARNEFEKAISDSWPRVVDPESASQLYEWSKQDILEISKPVQGDLFDDPNKPF